MKEITQAFMNVLIGLKVKDETVKAIVQMFWEQPTKMDKLVQYIKENPKATEMTILKKAVDISK